MWEPMEDIFDYAILLRYETSPGVGETRPATGALLGKDPGR